MYEMLYEGRWVAMMLLGFVAAIGVERYASNKEAYPDWKMIPLALLSLALSVILYCGLVKATYWFSARHEAEVVNTSAKLTVEMVQEWLVSNPALDDYASQKFRVTHHDEVNELMRLWEGLDSMPLGMYAPCSTAVREYSRLTFSFKKVERQNAQDEVSSALDACKKAAGILF